MPGGNGTGPAGAGPMTGRGMGICAGFSVPGYANSGGGRGMGMGRGGRMGRGRGFGQGFGWTGTAYPYPVPQRPTAEQELEVLKGQANYFENSLEETKQRIDELQRGNK